MDPNIKLILEEMAKLRTEMKECFASQEASFSKRLDVVAANMQIHDARVTNLEETAAAFDKTFTEWRLVVDSSITAVKLELSMLNSFFDRDVKAPSSFAPGVLCIESASARPPAGVAADSLVGHRCAHDNWDCGYGRVYTHTHDPVKGTIPMPPPKFPALLESAEGESARFTPNFSSESTVPFGKLPKINFPKFDGKNPMLWQSRCENYFEMYSVESSVWVRVATMHFEGAAAHWLMSVDHRIRAASWSEVCSWIHDHFGHDQHESLIRQLFHIKQTTTVQDYIDRFTELVDQLVAYEPSSDHRYYTTHFVDGLKDVLVQRPVDLDAACVLALLQEEAVVVHHKAPSKPDMVFRPRHQIPAIALSLPPPPSGDKSLSGKEC
jgi:hypothetical protein